MHLYANLGDREVSGAWNRSSHAAVRNERGGIALIPPNFHRRFQSGEDLRSGSNNADGIPDMRISPAGRNTLPPLSLARILSSNSCNIRQDEARPTHAPPLPTQERRDAWRRAGGYGRLPPNPAGLVATGGEGRAEDRAPMHVRSLDILDSHPDATFAIDRRRRVIAWNAAMERLTGIRREDILGTDDCRYALAFYGRKRPMLIDWIWDQDGRIEEEYGQIERKGSVISVESRVPALYQDREGVVCERVSLWTDVDGQVLGAIESIQDLTDKRSREEGLLKGFHARVHAHREQMLTLISTLPIPIYILDPQLRFEYINRSAARSLERDVDALVGRTWGDLGLSEGNLPLLEEAVRRVFETETATTCELPHPVRQTGMEYSISPLYGTDGDIESVFVTARDYPKAAKADEHLLSVARELRRSNEELERFAYAVSHDLQEPLRAIVSYTQLLSRRYSGELDADADEFIGFIVDGASRMQALIHDLLLYSRVSSGAWTAEPLDMEAVLAETLDNLRTAIEETQARVTHDPLPTIHADAVQMVRLLQNLIGNGIKFHRDGVSPRIHIQAERRGREWIFSIQDNGIGIDPKFHERIFEVFQRLHTQDTYSGTGIGLPICRKIVDQHGGRIWVESEPGKGSVFFFSIPISPDGQ